MPLHAGMARGVKLIPLALVASLLLALLIAWTARFRIATGLVERRLSAAGVPASYRIARIGPFTERMEDIRIGDPARPDLTARRIDVTIGYAFGGPFVAAVRADGVAIRAALGPDGFSLGSLDRLLPKAAGSQPMLPDIGLVLRDARATLTTPNGVLQAFIEGDGNPQAMFAGTAKVTAARLRVASCALTDVAATWRIAARAGEPDARGPVRIARVACPGLRLASGITDVALSSDRLIQRIALRAGLEGFGGSAGPARFAGIGGQVKAAGRLGTLDGEARLAVRSLSFPVAAQYIAQGVPLPSTVPIAATVLHAKTAMAQLLSDADAEARLQVAIRGDRTDVAIEQIALTGHDGARLTAIQHGGLRWGADGWRADADVATGGGSLPALALRVRQAAPGAPVIGTGALLPYRAGAAKIAAAPLRFAWDGRGGRLDATLLVDGPIGNGFVHDLVFPISGHATASGAFVIGEGCQAVAFRRLTLASFTFDAARFGICGQPIVASRAGGLRIEATTRPLHLAGRTSSGAPVMLAMAGLHLTERGFSAHGLEARIGPPDESTYAAVIALDGHFDQNRVGGIFAQASGAIANVPLDLADADGAWALDGGVLRLDGELRISDADAAPRFHPLAADHATLRLAGSLLTATADLLKPTTRTTIATVNLSHDLSSGIGGAKLAVPGIHFLPKGLQPEKLTPLTLGVIANVDGTIAGGGRIDWGAHGVTSSGTFGTERIDFAAAFGPVTGIRGTLHFSDLLGLVSPSGQEATIAEINPGVSVGNGVVHYRLVGGSRVQVEDALWPFAGGTLRLDPTLLVFDVDAERRLTFRVEALDAAAFVQQLAFPNISATGTFDGVLPMIFDSAGGRIEGGSIVARAKGGSLAYVGELSNAALGTMGKLAFDALKAIRYSSLDIGLDGRLDGEMVSRVRFTGVREATAGQTIIARLIRNLPFRFNIAVRAPFRSLVGSARAYIDPRLLLTQPVAAPAAAQVQPPAREIVR